MYTYRLIWLLNGRQSGEGTQLDGGALPLVYIDESDDVSARLKYIIERKSQAAKTSEACVTDHRLPFLVPNQKRKVLCKNCCFCGEV